MQGFIIMISKIVFIVLFIFSTQNLYAGNNLQLIESNPDSGFAIYRSGKPKWKDFIKLCKLGIEEVMVLSGTADEREFKYLAENNKECKNLKVIFNKGTSSKTPLSKSFLDYFDNWVTDAKLKGKKILFRCECGCHRTGRLAAYYQMRFQKLSLNDTKILAKKHGVLMTFYQHIFKQIDALYEYINDMPCSKGSYCVRENE